ncbi:hypothetical protein CE91St11_27210 [Bacteroides uniformis]|nr:hypothetical protein CE91St10_27210 [Bacteroides uniformis]GKH29547.1 hypothetical protein CE91St11_27210 [Bacteroides uniformis]
MLLFCGCSGILSEQTVAFITQNWGGVISNLITFVIFITLSYLIALGIEQLKKLTAKNHG